MRQLKQRGPLGTLGLWGSAVAVGALVATATVVPAQAAPPDVTEAEGLFLSGSGIVDVDTIAELQGAYSSYAGGTAGDPQANPLDLTVLQSLGIQIGGGVQLLGQNGILQLGAASQYGATSATGSTAASGLITADGAVQAGDGSPAQQASLDLSGFLSDAQVAGLADQLSLELGALSSSATATRTDDGYDVASDYQVDGARLQLHSPAVSALTGDLNETIGDLDTAVNGTTTALPGTIEAGVLTPIRGALSALGNTLTLADTQAVVTANVDLPAVTDPILAAPLTSGPVTVDLSTGDVTVDVAALQSLDGLPANTELLTGDAVNAELQTALSSIFDTTLPDALRTAVTQAVNTTEARVLITTTPTVNVNVLTLGTVTAPLARLSIDVDTTLGALVGTDPTRPVATTSVTPLPNSNGAVEVLLAPLRGTLGTLTTGVSDAVETALPGLTQPTLGPILGGAALEGVGDTLSAATGAVADVLSPLLDVVNDLVSVTVNSQTGPGFRDPNGTDSGASTVRALRLAVLPGADALVVDLAGSTVNAQALDALTINTPAPNDGFVVFGPNGTTTVTVGGLSAPGAVIDVAIGDATAQTTASAEGTWSVGVPGVVAGLDQTVSATQTIDDGAPSAPVSVLIDVRAAAAVAITDPDDGDVLTVGSSTSIRDVVVTGTVEPGATVVVSLDGDESDPVVASDPGGTWTVTFPGVGIGSYDLVPTETVGGIDFEGETVTVVVREVGAGTDTAGTATDST
ncbi:choice-of-anchor G family protein, partial [Frigoribacterium faeni]